MHPIESPDHPLEREAPPHASGRPIVITLCVLLVLTAVSWAVSTLPLGVAGTVIALFIAAIKAGCVIYAFMELPLASTPARIVVIVTLSFIALLCAGTVGDIGLR